MGTLNNSCSIIIGTQKGTIILTTTHFVVGLEILAWGFEFRSESARLSALSGGSLRNSLKVSLGGILYKGLDKNWLRVCGL